MRVRANFLPGPGGPLALVLWEPPADIPPRCCVLYVPPFGEEQNKARRTAALQARALAAEGAVVALLDLRGTGDSAGDLGDASWRSWRADVETAWAWLTRQYGPRAVLWGMRLGALLATELVADRTIPASALVLWQPVPSGRVFFSQFLRLAGAQQMTGRGTWGIDVAELRARLAAGASVEIGGYELPAALVGEAEAVDMAALRPLACPVIWLETVPSAEAGLAPASAKIAEGWRAAGVRVDVAPVPGPSFWASQEIEEAPALVAATTQRVVALLASEGCAA
jgi:exosortase A-associated hydrolase 2